MQHLTLEALARLVDEPPGRAEAAHLDGCDACRAELAALRRDVAALGRLGPVEPEPGEWAALDARLEHEGMLSDGQKGAVGSGRGRGLLPATGRGAGDETRVGQSVFSRTRARPWAPRLLRLAAALALYVGGAATGLALHGRLAPATAPHPRLAPTAIPGMAATSVFSRSTTPFAQATSPAVHAEPPAVSATAAASARSPRQATSATDESAGASPEAIASAGAAADRGPGGTYAEPGTPAEAVRAIRAAQAAYIRAYSRYAELTSRRQEVEDPVARAAALESIVLTTRAALDRAPSDPVINGYHLSAIAQRDAALRQIVLRANGRWF